MSTTIGTGNPLEHANFAVPPLHIPDGEGGAYKTELVLERSKLRCVKIQWWHAPDPREDPHNHPWCDAEGVAFTSTVLDGWLTMTNYTLVDGVVFKQTVTHKKGDTYEMPWATFHTVDAVGPDTVTRMVTGPLVEGGDWGHLVPGLTDGQGFVMDEWGKLGAYVSASADPKHDRAKFGADMCQLNPHKRPKQ